MTHIHAQTPAFPQTSRTGLVLAIAMASQWEMVTPLADIVVSVL